MKKFVILIFIAITLFSCGSDKCLFDIIVSATLNDDTVLAGNVICYGKMHENSVSDGTLTEYLGIKGYPEFKDKIDEMCVYSSVGSKYCELAMLRLYRVSDVADAVLLFERRIKAVKRAGMFDIDTSLADSAVISVYGNTVVLYMMDDNEKFQRKVEKEIS